MIQRWPCRRARPRSAKRHLQLLPLENGRVGPELLLLLLLLLLIVILQGRPAPPPAAAAVPVDPLRDRPTVFPPATLARSSDDLATALPTPGTGRGELLLGALPPRLSTVPGPSLDDLWIVSGSVAVAAVAALVFPRAPPRPLGGLSFPRCPPWRRDRPSMREAGAPLLVGAGGGGACGRVLPSVATGLPRGDLPSGDFPNGDLPRDSNGGVPAPSLAKGPAGDGPGFSSPGPTLESLIDLPLVTGGEIDDDAAAARPAPPPPEPSRARRAAAFSLLRSRSARWSAFPCIRSSCGFSPTLCQRRLAPGDVEGTEGTAVSCCCCCVPALHAFPSPDEAARECAGLGPSDSARPGGVLFSSPIAAPAPALPSPPPFPVTEAGAARPSPAAAAPPPTGRGDELLPPSGDTPLRPLPPVPPPAAPGVGEESCMDSTFGLVSWGCLTGDGGVSVLTTQKGRCPQSHRVRGSGWG